MKPIDCHTQVRQYAARDMQACIEIFLSNCPKYLAYAELKLFRAWLNKNAKDYKVIWNNSKVIGGCGFRLSSRSAAIAWHIIHSRFHKGGYGTKILKNILRQIKKSGASKISLDTSPHTYKFYEKFCFKVDKIIKDYYEKGLDRYDMSMKIK